jgi:membrane-associated phospholipid phosphatase
MVTNNPILEPEARSLPPAAAPPLTRGWVGRAVRELALQDWLAVVYLTILVLALAVRPYSAARTLSLTRAGALLFFCVAGLMLVRGRLFRDRPLAPLTYRLALHGTVQASYFYFRDLLPVASPGSLDAELAHVDLNWLHVEPSLWFDRFVTPGTTEWFAFFYYSYFMLLAVHVVPLLYFSRRVSLLAEFSMGVVFCFACGHVLYLVVPGYGPVRYLADQFHNTLPRGFWMGLVLDAVDTAGAQKDIFPSLHTAIPVFLTLFSFRHRAALPFKYTWPVVGFFAANIVIATMFLRWHYLIDVVAGFALACTGFLLSARLAPREVRWRDKRGLSPVWQPLFGRPS